MTDFQYPIGKFQPPGKVSDGDRQAFIQQIEEAPAALRPEIPARRVKLEPQLDW